MKIFWTIVVIIVLVLGFKLLTGDSAPEATTTDTAAVVTDTEVMAEDAAMMEDEEGAAMEETTETPAN